MAHLPGDTFFGEMSILGQGMYENFAEAAEESILSAMSHADVERLLLTKPIVALRVLQVVRKRLMYAQTIVEDLAFRSDSARMAALLLRLAQEPGSNIITGLTQQGLAEMAGTFRETATQALNELKAQGLIAIGRTRIEILGAWGL